mmetsp:Transcript_10658/g.15495  ORF Transcript_10658/g.15495 Transcript_10658/m.15495 type:complete len:86 (+) Transcript_10658:1359-1616(+)
MASISSRLLSKEETSSPSGTTLKAIEGELNGTRAVLGDTTKALDIWITHGKSAHTTCRNNIAGVRTPVDVLLCSSGIRNLEDRFT